MIKSFFSGKITVFYILSIVLFLSGCKQDEEQVKYIGTDIAFSDLLMPVPRTAQLSNEDYRVWGASMIRTDDGVCHLFYSRWPKEHQWVTHSEIAYAVADNPLGPYSHVDVALPQRGKEYWDGLMTHNPTIHHFEDKYYLYYVGCTGDGKTYHLHRNKQRIGVAVADHPSGPWERFDKPLIDVSPNKKASDAIMVTNPAIARGTDGKYVLVYKAAGTDYDVDSYAAGIIRRVAKSDSLSESLKNWMIGRVVHRVATSDQPFGPFQKNPGLVFDAEGHFFPAEDPYIWHQDDRFLAIVKDFRGAFTDLGKSLVLFESYDGIDWQLCSKPLASKIEINWEDGITEEYGRVERPQIYFEDGKPSVLFVAVSSGGKSKNVHIPLKTNY